MTIYYLLILFIGACSFFTLNMRNINRRNKMVVICSGIAIVLVQGLRSITVGVDLIAGYIPGLRYAENMNFFAGDKVFNYEIGYSLYSQLFAKLNVSDQLYLFIVAITIIVPIAYIWLKNSKMPGLSVFIYVTLGFFVFSFSGLRQAIAIAITFYSFNYILGRNFKKFILCIILAMFFHTSAIVFLLAYPLFNLKINNKNLFFVIIPAAILVFCLRAQIFLFIYRLYEGKVGFVEHTNAYTMLLVMIFVWILSYIFGSKNNDDLRFNAYKNYMLFAIFFQIFASQSNIVMRAGYYYYIFITLLIPDVIMHQKDKVTRMIVSVVLVFALIYFFQAVTSDGYLNVCPYHFYWDR
jgi:hypothetical protein